MLHIYVLYICAFVLKKRHYLLVHFAMVVCEGNNALMKCIKFISSSLRLMRRKLAPLYTLRQSTNIARDFGMKRVKLKVFGTDVMMIDTSFGFAKDLCSL